MAANRSRKKGFIRAYGEFWDRSEVSWAPGRGVPNEFRLLGRVGTRHPKLEVCDFRQQRGIYILHDDYGAYYVGLAIDRDIGLRLRDHTRDHHAERWDRFSWFGFRTVLTGSMEDGTKRLGQVPDLSVSKTATTIRDVETMLTRVLGTHKFGNRQIGRFATAERWTQVRLDQWQDYL